jgi:Integrase core domain
MNSACPHGEFESECPGYCGAPDTFYVGNMKGVERLHKTMLNEFYRIAFRKKLYISIRELQDDLDLWIKSYDEERPHQGRWCFGNASRHSALSYEHAGKIEAQLQAEVAELMAKAEAADAADIPDGMSIPDELARREERLSKIAEARAGYAQYSI